MYYPGKFYGSGVWPGFDDSGVDGWGGGARSYPRDDGELYVDMWDQVLTASPSFVMLMTFNDWNEGTEIEPSIESGFKYLEITADYASLYKNELCDFEIIVPEVLVSLEAKERYDVDLDSNILFGFSWFNGESFIGEVRLNGMNYSTDRNGKVSLVFDSTSLGEETIILEALMIEDKEHSLEFNDVNFVWDRLNVLEIGATSETVETGDSVTVWCKVVYEYDSLVFDDSYGSVLINGEEMVCSSINGRWELDTVRDVKETVTFRVSQIDDRVYDFASINDGDQSVVVEWHSKGIPGLPVESLLIGIILIILLQKRSS